MSALAFLAKKSWHTKNMKNVKKVWEKEQQKNAEDKKIAELKKQIEEEREQLDMQRMHEASAGKKGKKSGRQRGLNWMYKGDAESIAKGGPTDQADEERKLLDEFLMGKKLEPSKTVGKAAGVDDSKFSSNNMATAQLKRKGTDNNSVSKSRPVHEDPLFLISQQRLAKRMKMSGDTFTSSMAKRQYAEISENGRSAEKSIKQDKESKKEKKRRKKEKKKLKKEKKRLKKEKKKEKKRNKRKKKEMKGKGEGGGSSKSSSSSGSSSDDEAQIPPPSTTPPAVDVPGPSAGVSSYGLQGDAGKVALPSKGATSANLGPTAYIIGKRKGYVQERQCQSGRKGNYRRQSASEDANHFLENLGQSLMQKKK